MKTTETNSSEIRIDKSLAKRVAEVNALGAQSYAAERAWLQHFLDGWLARRLNATSVWGAILDPIADKVLVCAAVLGLLALAASPMVVVPAAVILFREFTISALREALAGRVTLAVTLLAKWKTTLQLIALAAELVVATWSALDLPPDPGPILVATWAAHSLLWLAAAVTLITGAQYLWQARKALAAG